MSGSVDKATKALEIPMLLEVPVGPQHPAVHEPILLKVYASGEEVVRVEINTGYNHRGIEKLAEKNSFYRDIFIVGRVCGICNGVHANCYVRALEQILDKDPPQRAKYLRTLVMELERIHSHILILAIMAEILGYETLFMHMMKDRELVMKAKEIVTGNRVIADYNMVGGVRRDLDTLKTERILDLLKRLRPRVEYYMRVFEEDVTIRKRLMGVGKITPNEITSYSLLGPIARGSSISTDARHHDKYEAYGDVPYRLVVRKELDSWGRSMVRFEETLNSIEMSEYILTHLPQGEAVVDEKRLPRRFPEGEAFTRVEAPRGELTYYVLSKGGDKPYRVKIRTPSFTNIINSGFVYLNHTIADVPVILVSFDPCISCMERVTVVDLVSGERKKVPMKQVVRGKV